MPLRVPNDASESGPRRYANWLDVTFSAEDFVLDFGQRFDDGEALRHSGIVATPSSVQAFVDLLTRSLAEYRRRHGGAGTSRDGERR
jgi:hypothetical protein